MRQGKRGLMVRTVAGLGPPAQALLSCQPSLHGSCGIIAPAQASRIHVTVSASLRRSIENTSRPFGSAVQTLVSGTRLLGRARRAGACPGCGADPTAQALSVEVGEQAPARLPVAGTIAAAQADHFRQERMVEPSRGIWSPPRRRFPGSRTRDLARARGRRTIAPPHRHFVFHVRVTRHCGRSVAGPSPPHRHFVLGRRRRVHDGRSGLRAHRPRTGTSSLALGLGPRSR
jgi:hypothetical protein